MTIRLLLAGTSSYAISTPTGGARPDVASYFKVPAFANAGFQADAAFDHVAPGQYRVFEDIPKDLRGQRVQAWLEGDKLMLKKL